jgi:iron complex outermembrane receptor protein
MTMTRDPIAAAVRRALQLSSIVSFACLSPAFGAETAESSGAAGGEETLEEVYVFGRGETRQVQTVSGAELAMLPAGTSPLKAIEKLPGVNFQSADPYGAYEWSARITVRGFNQNRLGYTLDGVPLGDMTYGNHNGLHISRAIAPENVERTVLSQGTGALSTASANNLGGTVQFFSADPAREFGARLEGMAGSDSARRLYGRFDSGELGAAGARFSLSAVDATTDKWKGGGEQEQRLYNFKLVQPIGDAKLTAFYNYSDRAEIDYQDLSFDILRRRGNEWDNWFPNWGAAVVSANACAASGFNDAVACDDAYWNASGLRKDDLGYLALALPFGDSLSWDTMVYLHENDGQGLWGTPYVPTPGGAPLSIRTTEYDLERTGAITGLTWRLGSHELNAGVWYETNDFTQARRFYGEPSAAAPTRSFLDFQRNPFRTDWEYDFETETVQFHLQDTISVGDAWRFNVGFKSLRVENTAATIVGPDKSGTIEAEEGFLPQAGFVYELSGEHELFGAVARNMRAFASSNTSGPFSTTAAGFAAIRDVLEPETSTTYELGWRFDLASVKGVLTAYHVDFDDRLLGIQQGPGIVGNPAVLANVGSVKTNGVEAALIWRPIRAITWFSSASWNDSEFADSFRSNGVLIPVDGKQVPDAPEILLKTELAYDDGGFFARLGANYVDERFYTYLNQGGVDAYTVVNGGLGYRFGALGFVEELLVQGDVTNLADEDYISTIDSNGFVNADPTGTTQTLLRGAPRQFFFSVKARF